MHISQFNLTKCQDGHERCLGWYIRSTTIGATTVETGGDWSPNF